MSELLLKRAFHVQNRVLRKEVFLFFFKHDWKILEKDDYEATLLNYKPVTIRFHRCLDLLKKDDNIVIAMMVRD